MNSFMNSFMNSCCEDEKQQQFFETIFDYFGTKIPDPDKACKEAAAFIQYNRENYGENHLTARNYKKHANAWIDASKNKPKKKKSGRGGKTAAEVAESQGVTVGELLNVDPLPVHQIKKQDIENTPDIFGDLFGG